MHLGTLLLSKLPAKIQEKILKHRRELKALWRDKRKAEFDGPSPVQIPDQPFTEQSGEVPSPITIQRLEAAKNTQMTDLKRKAEADTFAYILDSLDSDIGDYISKHLAAKKHDVDGSESKVKSETDRIDTIAAPEAGYPETALNIPSPGNSYSPTAAERLDQGDAAKIPNELNYAAAPRKFQQLQEREKGANKQRKVQIIQQRELQQ